MTAHPRSRGENVIPQCGGGALGGSSPLTRGKRGVRQATGETVRLIPAHAGKTAWRATAANPASAHPRSRGENYNQQIIIYRELGSSPLTRGKPVNGDVVVGFAGLIPAHAGKTAGRTVDVLVAPGSSPLTRGKHFLTCAFTAQIDQILETLELAASFGSYLIWVACATDAPQDPVRSIGLVLPSSMGAS